MYTDIIWRLDGRLGVRCVRHAACGVQHAGVQRAVCIVRRAARSVWNAGRAERAGVRGVWACSVQRAACVCGVQHALTCGVRRAACRCAAYGV